MASDATRILSWSADNTLRLWDVATGRLGQFLDHPRGFRGQREPQSILKTDECGIVLELGHEGKFVYQITRLRSKRGFP